MELEAALKQAANENGLPDYYVDIVRPLLRIPKQEWPTCCGGGCDPCYVELATVAERTLELMGAG